MPLAVPTSTLLPSPPQDANDRQTRTKEKKSGRLGKRSGRRRRSPVEGGTRMCVDQTVDIEGGESRPEH
jgi:hypothetical protein